MSEVLLEFAAPMFETFDADIPARRIMGVATTAWNLALLPARKRDEFLAEMARELSLETQDIKEMKKVMRWLVARKNKHFAEHRRFVVDFEVSERGNRRRLYVVSSADLPKDPQKQG